MSHSKLCIYVSFYVCSYVCLIVCSILYYVCLIPNYVYMSHSMYVLMYVSFYIMYVPFYIMYVSFQIMYVPFQIMMSHSKLPYICVCIEVGCALNRETVRAQKFTVNQLQLNLVRIKPIRTHNSSTITIQCKVSDNSLQRIFVPFPFTHGLFAQFLYLKHILLLYIHT